MKGASDVAERDRGEMGRLDWIRGLQNINTMSIDDLCKQMHFPSTIITQSHVNPYKPTQTPEEN